MEEYAPAIIPTIIGNEKSFIDCTPKMYIAPMVNNVVNVVLIERPNVWLILLLIFSAV